MSSLLLGASYRCQGAVTPAGEPTGMVLSRLDEPPNPTAADRRGCFDGCLFLVQTSQQGQNAVVGWDVAGGVSIVR